jgi:crossover junction endodeoxyribonuclease RuvC
MFAFGASFGLVRGVVASLGLPSTLVTPQRWKRSQGLTGRDKDAARTVAIARFPEIRHMLQRKKDCGRADAILIAAYGVENG